MGKDGKKWVAPNRRVAAALRAHVAARAPGEALGTEVAIAAKGLAFYGETTYVGDTYLNGVIYPMKDSCFPNSAERAGALYAECQMNFSKANNFTIHFNALYGHGTIMKDNYTVTVHVGVNGGDGTYDGTISDTKQIGFQKDGIGKQIMNGDISEQYQLSANDGELELNGAVKVSNSANSILARKPTGSTLGGTLSGAGTLTAPGGVKIQSGGTLKPGSALYPDQAMTLTDGTTLTFESGSAAKFHIGTDYVSQVICAEAVVGAVEVPVTIDSTMQKSGSWLLMEADALAPTFTLDKTASTGKGQLSVVQVLAADGVTVAREQLWYTYKTGLCIYVR